MASKDPAPTSGPGRRDALRDPAEELVRTIRTDIGGMPAEDVQALVHDLQVHEAELQIRNEELRHAQAELTASRDRYADLYEFAPVGYLTIDQDDHILEANLAAAELLGTARKRLPGTRMSRFVDRDSRDDYHLHRQAALRGGPREACEIQLRPADGGPQIVRLESIAAGDGKERHCRTAVIDITGKRKSEKALRRLNETLEQRVADRTIEARLLAEAVSHLGEGVLVTTHGLEWPGPEIVFVNEALCKITGYDPEELVGRSPRILQGEQTDRGTLDHLRDELRAGRSCLVELVNYRKDGTPYDAELFITPLSDAAGRHTNFVSIHRDVTERKRTLARLEESEERFRRIFENAVAGIAITDWERRFVQCNEAFCGIVGHSMDEMQRIDFGSLVHPEDRGENTKYLHRLRTGELSSFELENRYVRKDGDPVWVHQFISILRDDAGHPPHLVALVTDITERKEAEAARESLGSIVERSLNEVYIFDAGSLKFLQVNRGGRENLGYGMDELRDMTPLDLEPELSKTQFDGLLELLRSGRRREVTFETRHSRKDGSRYDVVAHLQMTAFRGRPCFVAIILDTTDRRKLEQEVVNATEEERQRIAGDLHDDLGSLLTGIKLRIEGLTTALATDDGTNETNSAAIAELVREAITKTRAIARGLRPVGNDPEDLLSALELLRNRVESGTRFRCAFLCSDPVLLDAPIAANHLFRIAQESVHNALKHSGGTMLTISLKAVDDTIELKVTDDGKGFDREDKQTGGLGLHIMEYRARAVNGTLAIDRGEQGGTEVTCRMPVKQASRSA